MSSDDNISINVNEIDDRIVNNDIGDLSNEINKIDNENVIINDNDVDITSPRIDKPVIEVSPNGTYLAIYNPENHSIVCWNAENIEEGQLAIPNTIKMNDEYAIDQIRVSDDKKLGFSVHKSGVCCPKIFDIFHNQEIELNLNLGFLDGSMCHTFNSKGEYIVHFVWNSYNDHFHHVGKVIWIFSTQTKNKKWICKRIYKIPEYFKLINISKYDDKLYLYSNNSIYEWDLDTGKGIKIFYNKEFGEENKSHYSKRELESDVRIFRNKMYIYLRIKDKIIIYSIELAIPVVSLDMKHDNFKLMKYSDLLPSLFPLLSSKTRNSVVEYCWKECLNRLGLKDEKLQNLPSNIQITDKYAFGILDEHVWKIKLEENISKIIQNSDDEIIENCNDYFDERFNYNLSNTCLDKIRKLFQKVSNSENEYDQNLKQNDQNLIERIIITDKLLQVWKIKIINHNKIMLRVFKKEDTEWKLTFTRITKFNVRDNRKIKLLEIELLNDDIIIIITTIGFLIYHFNEKKKSISLKYWNYLELTYPNIGVVYGITENLNDFKALLQPYTSQSNLPLPNYDSFKISDDWTSNVKDDDENFLKYGNILLSFAINEQKLDLIEEIYKKCISQFKKDLGNNRMFLSIITSTMPLLNKYYPEYVLRYSLETTMIIDHPFYSIEYQPNNLHLYSFQYLKFIDLTRSILWLKYHLFCCGILNKNKPVYLILFCIQKLMIILLPPIFLIYIAMFYILEKYHFVSDIFYPDLFSYYYLVLMSKLISKKTPMITFMVPYIKFINYPQQYNWFLELFKPQPSPFVETMNSDIYKTWSGEAIINFKWNTYGRFYYSIIWIGFMVLLGCFTAAATIPQQYIDDDIRKKLFIASIILGFIHLNFEVRQFIYNPLNWFHDFWNIFDIIAYLLPIYTSIYWLQTSEMNDKMIALLSFSCLFLDSKFLLFFRAFEYFGIYFEIMINVAKEIISFLVLLFIIIISFAHAFYILLLPRSDFSLDNPSINNDSNNPWNITSTYSQVFENGTIDSNSSFLIQLPDENTNMFIDFKTSLFATYLFLTGDSSTLSNWPYLKNPSLVILIVLFSLLIVVYLMNLLIGLLSNAIEKNNNRVSFLKLKAQILAEIELFYMLPYQRRWNEWFPEIIHYYANLNDIRKEILAMIDQGEWNTDVFSELKNDLSNKLNIQQNTAQQNTDN